MGSSALIVIGETTASIGRNNTAIIITLDLHEHQIRTIQHGMAWLVDNLIELSTISYSISVTHNIGDIL